MKSGFFFGYFLLLAVLASAQPSPAAADPPQLDLLARSARLPLADLASLRLSSSYTDVLTGMRHTYWQQYWLGHLVWGASASLHQYPSGPPAFHQLHIYPEPHYPSQVRSLSDARAEAIRLLGTPLDSIHLALSWERLSTDSLCLAWQARCYGPDLMRLLSLATDDLRLLAHRNLMLACTRSEQSEPEHSSCGDFFGECPPPLPTSKLPSLEPASIGSAPSWVGAYDQPPTPIGQYTCLPWPLESPLQGPLQVLSAASMVDETASPEGWHSHGATSYHYTRGNNVYAYYAPGGGTGIPIAPIQRNAAGQYLSGNVPDVGASLNFEFNQSLDTDDGKDFLESAIVNAFVSANRMHDLLLHYGFDEAAGNFQVINTGAQGADEDPALIQVQHNNLNQAFFTCPVDGMSPYMRLHLWNGAFFDGTPDGLRDGAFDNLVMAHEYAHGLLFRMVGGPNNVNCLDGHEQGSEGYCDVVGMLVTLTDRNNNGLLEVGVPGEGIRSIGTYLQHEAPDGPGLRRYLYTPNMALNPVTYANVPQLSAPHQVGFVWGSMLWDVVWDLIEEYGYTANLYDASSGAGNTRALRLLVESLRYLACDPDFLDMRDALLQADTILYGGQLSDRLWACFARRGLGLSAQSGGMAAYDVPGSALPVEWLSFEARPRVGGIELYWATAVEQQNLGFVVERRSERTPLSEIGWLDARAAEGSGANYYYFDQDALPGVTYLYRLRQKDVSGTESYSPWQSAEWQSGEESPLLVWPNPTTDQLYLSWIAPAGSATLRLTDMQGRVLAVKQIEAHQTLTLDLSDYPKGWLAVWLTTDGGHSCQRFLHLP